MMLFWKRNNRNAVITETVINDCGLVRTESPTIWHSSVEIRLLQSGLYGCHIRSEPLRAYCPVSPPDAQLCEGRWQCAVFFAVFAVIFSWRKHSTTLCFQNMQEIFLKFFLGYTAKIRFPAALSRGTLFSSQPPRFGSLFPISFGWTANGRQQTPGISGTERRSDNAFQT